MLRRSRIGLNYQSYHKTIPKYDAGRPKSHTVQPMYDGAVFGIKLGVPHDHTPLKRHAMNIALPDFAGAVLLLAWPARCAISVLASSMRSPGSESFALRGNWPSPSLRRSSMASKSAPRASQQHQHQRERTCALEAALSALLPELGPFGW